MARRRTLTLRPEQQHALTTLRDHTKYEYVRERCAALLKIAGGRSPHWVARHGLLQPRDPDTLYSWLDLYAAEGTAGLQDHRHGGPRRGPL
jgi:Helix-turn-helix domain